jgi:AcrR family transcriptional regulator
VLLEAVIEDGFGDLVFPSGDASIDDVLKEASAIAVARPLGVLWSREARHLPEEPKEEVRAILRRSAQGYSRLLQRERPELSDSQADLLAWGILSVMASPSYRSVRTSSVDQVGVLMRAGRAVAGTSLPSSGRRAEDGVVTPAQGMAPFSRRERLLQAAIRLFAEQGYLDTSMDDIGAQADVTGPNLYGYFASKAALMRAVTERGTHALWLDLEEAYRHHADPCQVLEEVAARYVTGRATRPHLGRQLSGDPELEEMFRAYQREYVAEWVALVRACRPELDQRAARQVVHVALTVADDVIATGHLVTGEGFVANLTAMVVAVLHS